MYTAQAHPQIDAELAKKAHFGTETRDERVRHIGAESR